MSEILILSIVQLAQHWQISPRTVQRLVDAGVLRPVMLGRRVGFSWEEIHEAEGGQPPVGLEASYRQQLLTPNDAARLGPLAPSAIRIYAKRGDVPHRRIGAQIRFVRSELAHWFSTWPQRDPREKATSGRQKGSSGRPDLKAERPCPGSVPYPDLRGSRRTGDQEVQKHQ